MDFVVIGTLRKPFGLLGEIKARPKTHDPDRIKMVTTVYIKAHQKPPLELKVKSARIKGEMWYLKFHGYKTPEEVKQLSGCEIMIPQSQRLPVSDDMIYISDVVGMEVVDPQENHVGEIIDVIQNAAGDLLIVKTSKAEIPVPWNEPFVKKIQEEKRRIILDIASLRPIYEN